VPIDGGAENRSQTLFGLWVALLPVGE